MTTLGYPLFIVSRATEVIGFHDAWASFVAGAVAVDIGFLMLYLLTWNTFRPQSRWCAWLIAAVACAFAVKVVSRAAETWSARSVVVHSGDQPVWRQYSGILASDLGYVWTAVEAFRSYAVLRRALATLEAIPDVAGSPEAVFALLGGSRPARPQATTATTHPIDLQ